MWWFFAIILLPVIIILGSIYALYYVLRMLVVWAIEIFLWIRERKAQDSNLQGD